MAYLEDKVSSATIVTVRDKSNLTVGYVITMLFVKGYEKYNIRMTASSKQQAYRYVEQYALTGRHRVSTDKYRTSYRGRQHFRQKHRQYA